MPQCHSIYYLSNKNIKIGFVKYVVKAVHENRMDAIHKPKTFFFIEHNSY